MTSLALNQLIHKYMNSLPKKERVNFQQDCGKLESLIAVQAVQTVSPPRIHAACEEKFQRKDAECDRLWHRVWELEEERDKLSGDFLTVCAELEESLARTQRKKHEWEAWAEGVRQREKDLRAYAEERKEQAEEAEQELVEALAEPCGTCRICRQHKKEFPRVARKDCTKCHICLPCKKERGLKEPRKGRSGRP